MNKNPIMSLMITAGDCLLINLWEEVFQEPLENLSFEEALHAYPTHRAMWRAALFFSLISLRKLADFAENRGTKPDDVNMRDFGLSLDQIIGKPRLLDEDLRFKINKAVAHVTTQFNPNMDELTNLYNEHQKHTNDVDAIWKALSELYSTGAYDVPRNVHHDT